MEHERPSLFQMLVLVLSVFIPCAMKAWPWSVSLLLACAPLQAANPKYGPAGKPLAAPLARDHAYLLQPGRPAPDFWRLNSFYVPQSDAYSCGAASVSMALNALLNADRPRSDQERNITQEEPLDHVKGDWQALPSPPG
ncbi:MAG: hypothetical protein PHU21_11230, partial [Elusimicrobia bacterium]|nr:hypothetical protein [Elusimicrobiota bacterium]